MCIGSDRFDEESKILISVASSGMTQSECAFTVYRKFFAKQLWMAEKPVQLQLAVPKELSQAVGLLEVHQQLGLSLDKNCHQFL